MIRIDSIKKQIKRIKPSQRSRHDNIIRVLDDIVDLIQKRCEGDMSKIEAIEILGEDETCNVRNAKAKRSS